MSFRRQWLFLATLICAIAVFQMVAIYWHLYFYIWWLDIPVHVLGGFWVGLFALVSYYAGPWPVPKERSNFFVFSVSIAAVLSVGLLWEVYEFAVDHAVGDSGGGLADTLMDLVDDLLGALLAAWIFVRGGYNGPNGQ